MTCNHKWVNYQPFQGEPYTCCAHAGCGITYEDWYKDLKRQQAEYEATLVKGFAGYWGPAPAQDQPSTKAVKDGTTGNALVKTPKGWVPVGLEHYLTPGCHGLDYAKLYPPGGSNGTNSKD